MKFTYFCITALVVSLIFVSPAMAKKRLVHSSVSNPTSVWIKPVLRSDHHALILALGNLNLAKSLTYRLTYTGDSVPQGVESNHQPATNNFQTELVFGTCSGAVCTYHQNLSDMFLDITISLNSGKTLIQRYQIKP